MREASIYTFRFNFVNDSNLVKSVVGQIGRVNRDGVILGTERIFYEDIYKVDYFHNNVVIALYPFPTVSREISERFIPKHSTLVVRVRQYPEDLTSVINQRISGLKIAERLAGMTKEERKHFFQKMNCPQCDASIDLTDLVKTPYIYCMYCESLFDKHGYLAPGGNAYKTCPETGFFDRIGEHTDFQMYYLYKESKFSSRKYFCSDALAELFFKQNALKNAVFGVGFFVNAWDKMRSASKRHPAYESLTEGNVLAMQGKMTEADEHYYKVLLRHPDHPGVHLNYALGYLKVGEEERALKHLRKSLDGCANYQPTKEILKKYTWSEEVD